MCNIRNLNIANIDVLGSVVLSKWWFQDERYNPSTSNPFATKHSRKKRKADKKALQRARSCPSVATRAIEEEDEDDESMYVLTHHNVLLYPFHSAGVGRIDYSTVKNRHDPVANLTGGSVCVHREYDRKKS